jgi:hypothetical protein
MRPRAAACPILSRHPLDGPIPFGTSLDVDTTTLAPHETARRIATHFGLPVG